MYLEMDQMFSSGIVQKKSVNKTGNSTELSASI